MTERAWEFWVDRGGTFTDVVGRAPDGGLRVLKLLSEGAAYDDAATEGIRRLLGLAADEPMPEGAVRAVKMGTTVATNALLERAGARTLLLITEGFGDLPRIGNQTRPRLFDLHVVLPEPLAERTVEIPGRLDADGREIAPLDEDAVRDALQAALSDGIEAAAIAFLHAYLEPAHEIRAAAIARDMGFAQVTASHEASRLIRLTARADTAVADAYLSPVLGRHVERARRALGAVPLRFMRSSGGLTDAALFRGRDAVLSGPAGGVVGMAATGAEAGAVRLIGFDMGGTSTDVSHHAGALERVFDTELAGVRLRAPMLDVHTIAAGGGSVLSFEDGRILVGPRSAGADPGPACYRLGGPLTVTDANVALGRIPPGEVPAIFGPDGDAPLDPGPSVAGFEELARRMGEATGREVGPEEAAEGFLAVAVDDMARAIRRISSERGRDPRLYALASFGGAGGQHACRVADALGIPRVIAHPMAGVLSALGMGMAEARALRERQCDLPLERAAEAEAVLDAMAAEAEAELAAQDEPLRETLRRARLRYEGSEQALEVAFETPETMAEAFEAAHRARFGYAPEGRAVRFDMLIAEAAGGDPAAPTPALPDRPEASPIGEASVWHEGAREPWPLWRRETLAAGQRLAGPAIVAEETATTVIEPGWGAVVDPRGVLILERDDAAASGHRGKAESAAATGSGHGTPDSERAGPSPPVRAERDAGRTDEDGASSPRDSAPEAEDGAYGPGAGGNASPGTSGAASADEPPDPVRLEILGNLFMSVAERMGATLALTARSVNIKERLDFSCAVFDARGDLVANAPHVPVHLGSMSDAVRAAIRAVPDAAPGDAVMMNSPYAGGTHLPDITLAGPVALGAETFWVAARGHHADVGGRTPGSAPPDATRLEEEGVVIEPVRVVHEGRLDEALVRSILASGPYPCRDPEVNLADIGAQIAALRTGADAMAEAADAHGAAVLAAYAGHVQDLSERLVRGVVAEMEEGRAEVRLDHGATIRVAIRREPDGRATVDLTGTSAQHEGVFNAPLPVARAVVTYVFRCLIGRDLPLNEGCLRAIRIVAPEGTLVNPRPPAAVVAGNTEISQALADALLTAAGRMAQSQGTMNNVVWGDERFQNYETIAGGTGAGPGFDGAGPVQAHMTNTRMTDPEVLERRFPVRLDAIAVRRGSGGSGRWRGGDGMVRRLTFLEPVTVTTLGSRRIVAPQGAAGGSPGASGEDRVIRAGGRVEPQPGRTEVTLEPGDAFETRTPGGGGWGEPEGA